MTGECTTHEQMKIYFVGRPEGKKILTRPSLAWGDAINMGIKGL